MTRRRVIFVPDDHWTNPPPKKEPTVTHHEDGALDGIALITAALDNDDHRCNQVMQPYYAGQDTGPLIEYLTGCVAAMLRTGALGEPHEAVDRLRTRALHLIAEGDDL